MSAVDLTAATGRLASVILLERYCWVAKSQPLALLVNQRSGHGSEQENEYDGDHEIGSECPKEHGSPALESKI
jgi:hypothetical protein